MAIHLYKWHIFLSVLRQIPRSGASMEKLKTSLDLEDEIRLHETGWAIQRIGWVIILLLLVAAALGIFGTGMLSQTQVDQTGHTIIFEKFARYEAPMQLTVHAKSKNNNIEIRLPEIYFESIELDKIVPEPHETDLAQGNVVFTFQSKDRSAIKFYLTPEKTGQVKVHIQVNESDFIITHFIYP